MAISGEGEDWSGMAKLYKKLTVGVSHRPIEVLLRRANTLLPFSEATAIHDNGSGPGQIMSRLISDYGSSIPASCALSASDFAPPMLEQLEKTKAEALAADPGSAWARVDLSLLNAMDMQSVADASKSHVTAGWVYFMTPDPQKALAETRRVLRDGGVLSLSSWKGNDWMDLMNCMPEVRPGAQKMEIPSVWRSVDGMRGELEKAGYRDVGVEEVPVELTFDKHANVIDMLMNLPHFRAMKLTEAEKEKIVSITTQEMKRMKLTEPGTMHGVSLVGSGRK